MNAVASNGKPASRRLHPKIASLDLKSEIGSASSLTFVCILSSNFCIPLTAVVP